MQLESKFSDILEDENEMDKVFEAFVRNFFRAEQTEFPSVKAEWIQWDAQMVATKWESFGRRGDGTEITLGSLFHMAKERGWIDAEFHTDLGNARRLIARHGDNIRFIPEWRKWITWDGTRWRVDTRPSLVASHRLSPL
jgi:hypothetical protein